MRGRRFVGFVLLASLLGAEEVSACNQAPAPTEDVSSSTGPPIKICYEPDGALCPLLDAGDDAGEPPDAPAEADVAAD